MRDSKINLPVLGKVYVMQDRKRIGHYLWLDAFGWHDCTPQEDKLISLSL